MTEQTGIYEYTTSTAAVNVPDNGQDAAPMVNVHVTEERMQRLKSGHWRKAQAGDYDAQMHVIAHFMMGSKGVYLGTAEALEVLDEFSMGEIIEALTGLQESIQEAAAPKA